MQAEGTNERTEESGGESGMIDGETEEGTRSAENETSKETGEGDEGSGAASSQEDSGGKESTVKKAEKTERSSNNGTEAEASKRGNDVDRKGGGDGLPAEATEQCGELRETSPPETASGGLLEDAERNDEHVKRKAESSETTGGGKGAGKAAAENGTSCPDSARGKRNGTEAHVVRPGGRNGGGNRKEERKRNGSSGRKELKEGTSKAADGSSAVDRARAVYSKKINPIWAVPKT